MSHRIFWVIGSFFCFLVTFFAVSPAECTTYYVSPTGSDSNPGTESLPWRTIGKAANTLIAGDSVLIKTGVYKEWVVPANSGSPGNYITYTTYPGDSVTIDGDSISLPPSSALFHIYYRDYIEVSGLRIMNSGPYDSDAGIMADFASHVIIKNNYTYNTKSSGIAAWVCDNVLIENNEVELACNDGHQECITVAVTDTFEVKNNHVHHGGPGSQGGEGIDAKDGSNNGKVYLNHVHDMNSVGIYVDSWDKHTYNIEVFQNFVHDIQANGFSLAAEDGGLLENIYFYNNIAYSNRWVGITIGDWGPAPNHPMRDIKIINNTFYKNGIGPWGGGISIDNPEAVKVIIRNNICSDNLSFQIALDDAPPESLFVDNNLIDGFRNYPGEIYGSDSVIGDPLFEDTLLPDFQLQQGSPAIDSGSSEYAPFFDYEGNPRPYGAGWDIGAYEYSGSGVDDFPRRNDTCCAMYSNDPNPFVYSTNIRYTLGRAGWVELFVYDASGRSIKMLVHERQNAGSHMVKWNCTDHRGIRVAPGVYFYKIQFRNQSAVGKCVVLTPHGF